MRCSAFALLICHFAATTNAFVPPAASLATKHQPPLKASGTAVDTTKASLAEGGARMATEPLLATLCIKCPDRTGVVAAVAQLLYGFGANILMSDQFSDDKGTYFQRLRFDYSSIHVGATNTLVVEKGIAEMAERYQMEWRISYDVAKKRMSILVSKEDHCLYDLLIRHRGGELACDIVSVVSNHDKLRPVAEMFGVPFFHFPMPTKEEGGKRAQETRIEEHLESERVDLVVLARYMQILSPDFCDKWWRKTINIHHSPLPAFEGARPYHRAHERGVKVIGATAHYATTDLDAGPIIEQSTTRISHTDTIPDMIRKGRDLERVVLARAVRWHLHDSVLVEGNKTVVFES